MVINYKPTLKCRFTNNLERSTFGGQYFQELKNVTFPIYLSKVGYVVKAKYFHRPTGTRWVMWSASRWLPSLPSTFPGIQCRPRQARSSCPCFKSVAVGKQTHGPLAGRQVCKLCNDMALRLEGKCASIALTGPSSWKASVLAVQWHGPPVGRQEC